VCSLGIGGIKELNPFEKATKPPLPKPSCSPAQSEMSIMICISGATELVHIMMKKLAKRTHKLRFLVAGVRALHP
jgi:hypothetical protein